MQMCLVGFYCTGKRVSAFIFFDDKAKYSCLKNNGSIAETLTGKTINYYISAFYQIHDVSRS